MDFFTLSRIGIILNFSGTIMVAFSVGKNPEDAYSEDKKGRPIYLASILYPRFLRLGLGVIAVGFLLQLFT
jgi:hypothetical protein